MAALHSPLTSSEWDTIKAKTVQDLKPSEINAIWDSLNRKSYNRGSGTDPSESAEPTLLTILG
jgi:hypothetical protein